MNRRTFNQSLGLVSLASLMPGAHGHQNDGSHTPSPNNSAVTAKPHVTAVGSGNSEPLYSSQASFQWNLTARDVVRRPSLSLIPESQDPALTLHSSPCGNHSEMIPITVPTAP